MCMVVNNYAVEWTSVLGVALGKRSVSDSTVIQQYYVTINGIIVTVMGTISDY